jgi:hypothetical protein
VFSIHHPALLATGSEPSAAQAIHARALFSRGVKLGDSSHLALPAAGERYRWNVLISV